MPDSPRPEAGAFSLLRRVQSRVTGGATDRGDEPAGSPAPPAPAAPAKPRKPSATKSEKSADVRWTRAYAKVARRVVGRDAFPSRAADLEYDAAAVQHVVGTAARQRALATFAERIGRGEPLDAAHVATVRALLDAGERPVARALSLGLAETQRDAAARGLGLGLALSDLHHYHLAWEQYATVPVDLLIEHVPVEAVQAALAAGTPEAERVALAVGAAADRIGPADLVELAGRFLVSGHPDLARDLVEEAERRAPADADERLTKMVANLRQWTHPVTPVAPPTGAVSVGVIDYHQPDFDRASRNVGDYVQTLAMLGNLARFQDVEFTGADGLGELVSGLQQRVRPGLRRQGPSAKAHLLPVSRDFSGGDPVPENTWTIAFGWHMHSTFRLGFGLPYHRNVKPIFLSFHVNRVGVLIPETTAYLRAHGPIGCRDWTTVDLLLSAGVDAFFTGCLTTTVSAVFPELGEVDRDDPGVVGLVDMPAGFVKKVCGAHAVVTHGDPLYRDVGLVDGTQAAVELLERYQRDFSKVVTTRLHSYLPATSLDLEVDFHPPIAGDVRFDGLMGMEPGRPEFVSMRDGIRELIAETFQLVLEGAAEEQVYARWRELTAGRVADAKTRFAAPPRAATALDAPGMVAQVRAAARRYGPHDAVDADTVTDVAMSLDANFRELLPVTVESLAANATGPLRLWVTARGLGEDYEAWVAAAFPDLPVTFLNFDGVEYGEVHRLFRHISVATMDRLLLPALLDDVDRITYVDIDTVTEGDVTELGRVDLRGRPLAARSTLLDSATIWRDAGDHLPLADASELRRVMSARHPFGSRTFNAGVMVLDLARMRADRFVEDFLPWAVPFGLNDQDILLGYAGPDRVELDRRWNTLPILEDVTAPGIVHYAGAGKPWLGHLVPSGHLWRTWADRSRERVGRPPG